MREGVYEKKKILFLYPEELFLFCLSNQVRGKKQMIPTINEQWIIFANKFLTIPYMILPLVGAECKSL